MRRLIAVVLLSALGSPVSAQFISPAYDSHFKDATDQWLPGRDWRELKAQCYQESLLKPDAVSHAGARGLCQFLDATYAEVPSAIHAKGTVFSPIASAHAAAWYMRRMRAIWKSPRPDWDRQRLAWASYNAGAGNLIRAQKACGGPSGFNPIMLCLPKITGIHSRETTTYVQRIDRWLIRLHAVD